MVNQSIQINDQHSLVFNLSVSRLKRFEPIQYILGEAYFYGRKYLVNPNVLIPRQETEELVDLIIKENHAENLKVLDIGAGSGCIGLTLAKELQNPEVIGLDINQDILQIIKENARNLHAAINTIEGDIFHMEFPYHFLDIIVSNPPYISEDERRMMDKNVVYFEPEAALFVSSENPLTFYHHIIDKAKFWLKPNGKLYFEINEAFGNEVKQLMLDEGFIDATIFKDLNGKDRIVRGINEN